MSDTKWYIRLNDEVLGPMSDAELHDRIMQCTVTAETPVSNDGTSWKEAAAAGIVFDLLPRLPADFLPPIQDTTPASDAAKLSSTRDRWQTIGSYAVAVPVLLIWLLGWTTFITIVLWIVVGASALFGIGNVVAAMVATKKDDKVGFGVIAGICAVTAMLGWGILPSRKNSAFTPTDIRASTPTDTGTIVIPDLPEVADARQITAAYKSRVALVEIGFVTTENYILWQEDVAQGGHGSGILLVNDRMRGVILTNRHVVDPNYKGQSPNYRDLVVRVKLASEKEWSSARIAARHNSLDLALVIVERPFATRGAVRVAAQLSLQQGEEVVALGNPLDYEFITTPGIIEKVEVDKMMTSCPISPGNSGGPLILKRRGLIAGITTAFDPRGQNVNFATVVEWGLRPYPPRTKTAKKTEAKDKLLVLDADAIADTVANGMSDAINWDWSADRKQIRDLLALVPVEE